MAKTGDFGEIADLKPDLARCLLKGYDNDESDKNWKVPMPAQPGFHRRFWEEGLKNLKAKFGIDDINPRVYGFTDS